MGSAESTMAKPQETDDDRFAHSAKSPDPGDTKVTDKTANVTPLSEDQVQTNSLSTTDGKNKIENPENIVPIMSDKVQGTDSNTTATTTKLVQISNLKNDKVPRNYQSTGAIHKAKKLDNKTWLARNKVQVNVRSECANTTERHTQNSTSLPTNKAHMNPINTTKEINILLLGATTVGKSTLINSIFNYLEHGNFTVALAQKLNVLIPSSFNIFDKYHNLKEVTLGRIDKNEWRKVGESATRDVQSYTFVIENENYLIRLIDTPGLADHQDNSNCENILNYISNLKELHAICYLCPPQQTHARYYFHYYLSKIMSRLHADACKNVVFVFTGCKEENYTSDKTYQLLKPLVDSMSKNPAYAQLKLDDNKFCFDNEAFRYLAAVKQRVILKTEMKNHAKTSWTKATEEWWRMLDYIINLIPYDIQQKSDINEARRLIYEISKPMADTIQVLQDNIMLLDRHKRQIDLENSSIQELEQKLFIPSINLRVTKLAQPVTVCTSINCSEIYQVDGRHQYHYKTRCHDPCNLLNVQPNIIGPAKLMSCSAMNQYKRCSNCNCTHQLHMHLYYITRKISVNKTDTAILQKTHEDAVQKIKEHCRNLEKRQQQYEQELDIIIKANAKFAYFLEKNAIADFTDLYAEYIQYQIIREKSLGTNCDMSNLTALQSLLSQHNGEKKILDNASKTQRNLGEDPITPLSILKTWCNLFSLPLNGKNLKQLYVSQKDAMKSERDNTEYKHNVAFKRMVRNKQANTSSNRSQSQKVRHSRSPTPPPSYEASQIQASNQQTYSVSIPQLPGLHTPPANVLPSLHLQLHPNSSSGIPSININVNPPNQDCGSSHNGQNCCRHRKTHCIHHEEEDFDDDYDYTGYEEDPYNHPVYDRKRYVWTRKPSPS